MMTDCHCHAGKGDGLTSPWNTDALLHHYLLGQPKQALPKQFYSQRSSVIIVRPMQLWQGL